MAHPETVEEHLKHKHFIADRKLVLTMAATQYDEVLRVNEQSGEIGD